ncbi:hypothetical protein VNO78_25854 [Psophocarpus tetragonolobus]|uniref:Uncharacterized protein n=1 Tax=Psophocarpus tetragonolobus TaxID=3891 RepID=A0AAN9S7P0_PSOTE
MKAWKGKFTPNRVYLTTTVEGIHSSMSFMHAVVGIVASFTRRCSLVSRPSFSSSRRVERWKRVRCRVEKSSTSKMGRFPDSRQGEV